MKSDPIPTRIGPVQYGRTAAGLLWQYRRFILGSVAREFRSRYTRTIFGAVWLLLAPFAMILVYTIIFSQVMHARLPGNDAPFAYSIFLRAGLFLVFLLVMGRWPGWPILSLIPLLLLKSAFAMGLGVALALGPGHYSVTLAAHASSDHLAGSYDWWERSLIFQVLPSSSAHTIGICHMPVTCHQ